MKKTLLVGLGYAVFAMVATITMLLWKFPYQDFNFWVLHKVNTPQSPIRLHVDTISPSYLPPGLALGNAIIIPKALQTTFNIPLLKLSLPLGDLVAAHPGIKVGGAIFGGDFSGSLAVDNLTGPEKFYFSLSSDDCDISAIPELEQMLKSKISGLLECDIRLEGRTHPLTVDTGKGNLTLLDAVVDTRMPFLKGGHIPLGKIDLDFTVDGGRINVTQCRFNSKQIKGELAGSIIPGRTLADTSVDLRGTYQIDPSLIDTSHLRDKSIIDLLNKKKKMPLNVTGKLPSLYIGFF